MDAALHEDARAVERQRLLHLAADLLERQQVALRVPRLAVEGAEPALVDADVRVIDVAVDVVRGDRRIVEAVAHLVGGQTQVEQVAFDEQRMRIASRDAAAGHGVVEDLLDGSSSGLQVHSRLTLSYPGRGMEELRDGNRTGSGHSSSEVDRDGQRGRIQMNTEESR